MNLIHALPPIAIGVDDFHRLGWLADTVRPLLPGISAFLQRELDRAEIVEPWFGLVTMGATVRYRLDDSASECVGRLVYPADVQRCSSPIPVLSELGVALIGLREGQSIYWRDAGGRLCRVAVIRSD